MAISFITAKTFPKRLELKPEEISEIINGPVSEVDKSAIYKDHQDMLDIIMDFNPAEMAINLSRSLSKLEDIFKTQLDEDIRLTSYIKEATSRVGRVRPTTEEEDKEQDQPTMQELARKALEDVTRKK